MRSKTYKLVFLILFLLAIPVAAEPRAEENKEYQIKAAFLYNFIKFTEWPKDRVADSNEPMCIGIIGKDQFGNAFEPLKNKKVKGRNIVVKRYKGFKEIEKNGDRNKTELQQQIYAIRKCHVLFICCSEVESQKDVINSVKAHSVLTVGDNNRFIGHGGIINFLMEEKKVRFEINNVAAKGSKLKISSKLLRMAKKAAQASEDGEK